jgi:hypothetical protein
LLFIRYVFIFASCVFHNHASDWDQVGSALGPRSNLGTLGHREFLKDILPSGYVDKPILLSNKPGGPELTGAQLWSSYKQIKSKIVNVFTPMYASIVITFSFSNCLLSLPSFEKYLITGSLHCLKAMNFQVAKRLTTC